MGGHSDPCSEFVQSFDMVCARAEALEDEERFIDSVPIYRQLITEGRECLAKKDLHVDLRNGIMFMVQRAARGLGNALACQGTQGQEEKLQEGERILRGVLEWFRRVLGPDNKDTLETTVRP